MSKSRPHSTGRRQLARTLRARADGTASYLRALMQPVALTHKQILDHSRSLMFVGATSGLAAVKLSKLRAANKAAMTTLSAAIDTLAQAHATRDADGKLVPKIGPVTPATDTAPEKPGEPQFFSMSNTPAYEMTLEAERAFMAALDALLAESATLQVALFTETDAESFVCSGPNGVPQPMPEPVAAALACFTQLT